MAITEQTASDPHAGSISVLVADDDPHLLLLICRTLRALKHNLAGHARNGREAATLVQELQPDLVILDVAMPGMDGIDAARAIRQTRNVPIILMTGEAPEATLERLRDLNIGAYLVKPFSPAQLKAAIFIAMLQQQPIGAASKEHIGAQGKG